MESDTTAAVSPPPCMMEITCEQVKRELCNYAEDDVSAELRARIELHVRLCDGCRAFYDGVLDVIWLVSSVEVIELPKGFSRRLRDRLRISLMN
jgi:hypothetical protein